MKKGSSKKRNSGFNRLSVILFFLASLSLFFLLSLLPKEKPPVEENEVASVPAIPAEPPLIENKEYILRGSTLSDILFKYDFSPAEIHKMREEVKPTYDLAKLMAGKEIRIYSSQDGKIVSFEYDIDDESYLQIEKKEQNYEAEIKKIPYEIQVKMIWGIIDDILINAVAKAKEEVSLAISLAELFAWDIDFYADLREGDSFKIIFEKKYLNDKFVGYRNILAAEFTNQGNTFHAYRFNYPDTKKWDYFDQDGGSLRKEFLKSPIGSARITSRFSYSRLHPIRKVYRPHFGVDYAARIGTPVQATADGTVTFVGWNGASGRMIKIRHKNNYETMYLHLRRYARGIKKGASIKGGQVIGEVGSSGESTGPHLDYRIRYRGKYINPLAWKFQPVKPLRLEFLEDFKKGVKKYNFYFEAPLILASHFRQSIHPLWPMWLFGAAP